MRKPNKTVFAGATALTREQMKKVTGGDDPLEPVCVSGPWFNNGSYERCIYCCLMVEISSECYRLAPYLCGPTPEPQPPVGP